MRTLARLFENNREWARRMTERDPEFFARLARQQAPDYLWIGCSDSRLPPNEITGLLPGELFVHRNVANVVVHTDFNCLAVLEFAVAVLGVEHVIVCGHHGCGGIAAALADSSLGLADNWLRHVRDVHQRHAERLDAIPDDATRHERLCELNVIEQVQNVCRTTVVLEAWKSGRPLAVHGWVYSLKDGLLRDLDVCVASADEVAPRCTDARAAVLGKT